MALVLRVPIDDVFIFAGGLLVFFELDFRREGALSTEDCSSGNEDWIDEARSMGRGRSWRFVPGKL